VSAPTLPFVSIVVPARNAEQTVGECLESMMRLDYDPERREILVVENASTDRTGEIIRDHPVRCLFESRRGASAARNRGVEAARGEIVAFTDADCVVTRRWLRELVRGFEAPDVWGVAGEIIAYPPRTPSERYLARHKARWQAPALQATRPFAVTSNVAFRRATFDRLGLFDTRLIKAQDKDFGWRFHADPELRLVYSPEALVLHRHRTTAWKLFTQHAGWGYGAALLHHKHSLPWSVRLELKKQAELARAGGAAGAAALRYGVRGGERTELEDAALELVRRLGLRVGALYGLATARRRLTPGTGDGQ
jgi:cellulose synthase/poly-beta-1,6-N-acetylglucosamine synthase-like glycosyltransferase